MSDDVNFDDKKLIFMKMVKELIQERQDDEQSKWGKRTYDNTLDALRHANAVVFLEPGQIVHFKYQNKSEYGVFYRMKENGCINVYWFDREEDRVITSSLIPDSILDILSFEELEKRLV